MSASPTPPRSRKPQRPIAAALARNSRRGLGARAGVAVHGPLLRDDPCALAALPRHRARDLGADGRHHRGHRGGDRLDRQDFLRRAERPPRQAQGAGGVRLRACRLHQADLSAGRFDRLADRRALHRSRRQGHSRRTARCADRRPHAARPARRELRPAAIARHRRRGARAARRDGVHAAARRTISPRCSGSR